MEKLTHGRTSFIIAHRLSTIKHADRILVIEAGRIAEMGTHASLLRARRQYFQLYTQHFRNQLTRDLDPFASPSTASSSA
jgi:ATP-binding cassette subfamily B protein